MGWHFTTDIFREPTGMSTSESHPDQSNAYFTSLDADGFTVGTPGTFGGLNTNGVTAVAWCWKAGGTGVANTDGGINSTVSANTAAGFSIVTYTGTGSASTVGHGLSKAPELVIHKNRDLDRSWMVGTKNALLDFTDHQWLETNDAYGDSPAYFDDTDPTASVFSVGTSSQTNGVNNILAYCWHSVEGYSKIGSYKGNGNADGSFIYTGFKPKFVITKPIEAASNWHMYDTVRSPSNPVDKKLSANTTSAEAGPEVDIDILSNGFKTRRVTSALSNNNQHYFFMAFAENSFKHATAR